MQALISASLCTRPVGFDGEFNQAKSAAGQLFASIATGIDSAPASTAPT